MEYSPVLELMKEYGAPLTRDEYIRWNNLGKTAKVSPEEEAEMPKRFAYPVVEHAPEPPKPPKAKAKTGKQGKQGSKGAPADFPGPVFPNPKGIVPQLDTDQPKMHPSKATVPMNMRLAPANPGIEPDPQVPREQ